MNPVIYTGFARTATTSMAILGRELGINSGHQVKSPPGRIRSPYDYKNPPMAYEGYAKWKSNNLCHLDSDWSLHPYLYLLEKQKPDIRFLVGLRDPVEAISSLYYMGQVFRDSGLVELIRRYDCTYLMILEQVFLMKTPPKLMLFEKTIQGKYNETLFGVLGLDYNETNRNIAKKSLKKKYRTSGDYTNLPDEGRTFERSKQIYRLVIRLIEEL